MIFDYYAYNLGMLSDETKLNKILINLSMMNLLITLISILFIKVTFFHHLSSRLI
jgi:hypothetical protein